MQKGDRLVFGAMLLLSAGFAGAAGLNVYRHHQAERAALEKEVLHVSATEVIGPHPDFLGDSRSPYTLVEFGDYQCPPCRVAQYQLPGLLKQYRGKVKFVFRNLPLTQLHPYAMQAAIAAEETRLEGKFWLTHDALYSNQEMSDIDSDMIRRIASLTPCGTGCPDAAWRVTAIKRVAMDMHVADTLCIHSTPTFLLCTPYGNVVKLQSLTSIKALVNDQVEGGG